ncbi:MAG: lipid-A-disaccharide synthase [Alphaproteobacteria bacterium]
MLENKAVAMRPYRVMMIAGEPSGDILGAHLLAELQQFLPALEVKGVGGEAMQAAGLQPLVPFTDLAVMGLAEVLPRLPKLIGHLRFLALYALEWQPDILITIDSPDFGLRLAKKLHRLGIKTVHVVAPSVWAWRAGRAKKIAAYLDLLLCLLPFEPPYFEPYHLPAVFIGHPSGRVIENFVPILPDAPLLILPGSRVGEVKRLAPIFADSLRLLQQQAIDLPPIIIPTFSHLQPIIAEAFAGLSYQLIIDADEKKRVFNGARAAMAASGTVTLELAACGVPHLVAYKVQPVSAWLAKRLLKTPYVNLINIIMQQELVPELLQEKAGAENIAQQMQELLHHQPMIAAQQQGFIYAMQKLATPKGQPAGRSIAALLKKQA